MIDDNSFKLEENELNTAAEESTDIKWRLETSAPVSTD
jgi:hypothetical protein